MATRGRKPKPTALKVLEGNPGKRPLNANEPVPPKGEVKCPTWLLPEAKKEWKRLAPAMEAMGILTLADEKAFAGYCQAYARWKEAEEFITQHGSIFKTPSGYVQQVPQVSIAQQNLKIIHGHPAHRLLDPLVQTQLPEHVLIGGRFQRLMVGVSYLVNGNGISKRYVLGIPAQFWTNLEAIYQEKCARVQAENEMEADIALSKLFPYGEMAQHG